jgi:hypothetical protein
MHSRTVVPMIYSRRPARRVLESFERVKCEPRHKAGRPSPPGRAPQGRMAMGGRRGRLNFDCTALPSVFRPAAILLTGC